MSHPLENTYTPIVLLAALQQKAAPSSFLRNMLVKDETMSDTDYIKIDIEKGGQKLAAFVARGGDANRVAVDGYTTNIHAVPYVSEEIRYTPKDLKIRMAGETEYTRGAKARMNKKIAKGLTNLRDRFARLEEWQLSRAIQTGKVVISGKGVNYTVDFQMDPEHIIVNTGTDLWSDAGADIPKQLQDMAKLGRDKGAPVMNRLIMGVEAANAFLSNDEVQKLLDNRRISAGGIDFEQLDNNYATWVGNFRHVGIDLQVYTYQATYEDENGDMQYYIDPKNIVMLSSAARIEAHYGMIENLNHPTMEAKEFPSLVVDDKGKYADLSLESGPLMALHQPDAVVVRTVLA